MCLGDSGKGARACEEVVSGAILAVCILVRASGTLVLVVVQIVVAGISSHLSGFRDLRARHCCRFNSFIRIEA